MKIMKLAEDQFTNEGKDPLENIHEKEQFEAKQDIEDRKMGKSPTYTSEVLDLALKAIGDRISASFVATGSVGWVEHNGIIYEILVSPARLGNYFSYFKDLQSRKNPQPSTDPTDTLD